MRHLSAKLITDMQFGLQRSLNLSIHLMGPSPNIVKYFCHLYPAHSPAAPCMVQVSGQGAAKQIWCGHSFRRRRPGTSRAAQTSGSGEQVRCEEDTLTAHCCSSFSTIHSQLDIYTLSTRTVVTRQDVGGN